MSVQVIDARGFRLRHIAPAATWPSEGGTATVLGRSYGFTVLPMSALPTSADLVEGSYSGRLGDSGEFTLSFPNVAGSKGLWRERFSANLSLEFIEIYRDDVLEFVGSIQRVEIDRGVVTVSGTDAWALLRRAYESDRSWTAAPRDVIEAYTRVPVPLIADDFDSQTWTISGGSASVSGSRITLSGSNGAPTTLDARATLDVSPDADSDWRMVASVLAVGGSSTLGPEVEIRLQDATGFRRGVAVSFDSASIIASSNMTSGNVLAITPRSPGAKATGIFTLQLERRGRWVYGFVQGELAGIVPWSDYLTTPPFRAEFSVSQASVTAVSVVLDSFVLTERQPFLARGSDLGKYVLPTDQPTGGLRGRYFDAAAMQGLGATDRAARLLQPSVEPYAERLDPTINTSSGLTLPLQPGNSGDYFAVRWFGSVYLRGDIGDYTFEVTSVLDGARLWVGKTAFEDALIDDWTTSSGTSTGVWDASDHGSDAGWYPIVLEYYCDTGTPAIRLQFTPPASGYTDPGGTSIVASTKITVPATSLSPLGCYDNRVQGTSHFDMVQGVAQQFGYQLWCEPMQLESGEFPGRLVPRLRVGRDTDVKLEPEDTDGVEPALSPGLTLDGSDQAVTLVGAGAGLADGKGSQVSAEVFDITGLGAALFNLQANVDAADIAFPDLLAARLSAELALRATPWEEVRATPRAQERLADTWPLSQTLAAMRWRPGDGLRLVVPDVGVEDTEPRQMIQVTRSFGAHGRTGTQVAFRQRPRSAARSVRSILRSAIASQRSYQGQRITLPSNFIDSSTGTVAAAGFTRYAQVALYPGDRIVRAYLRIALNSAAQSLGVEINGVDLTTSLGGPWTVVPIEVEVGGYATQASATDNRMYLRVENQGGSATAIEFQMFVEVLR